MWDFLLLACLPLASFGLTYLAFSSLIVTCLFSIIV